MQVETSDKPDELLLKLKQIEDKLGRVKTIDKGPRSIDLDILLWGGGRWMSKDPDLFIPHKLMKEREFVLRPLCEYAVSVFL